MPKILSKKLVKPQTFEADEAGDLFDKIEKFAGYGFNLSHSCEYTLISYQSMFLKTYYPVEFFAAALSIMDDDKLPPLLKDAKRMGIEIALPDINLSTHEFEILTDTKLCIPFSRVKGLSERAAHVIVNSRNDGKGNFKSVEDFELRLTDRRMVHKGKLEVLNKIGAFANIDPAQPAQNHPDRVRDQKEFIPGLITDVVPISRFIEVDKFVKARIGKLVKEYIEDNKEDGVHVWPTLGGSPRFVVITDAPTSSEEKAGKLAYGDSFGYVQQTLADLGLSRSDAYWTSLIKRPKEGKAVSPAEIKKYEPYLARELEILKSPVIVLLGSTVVRKFIPDFKGKASDMAGKVIYDKDLDANLVIGFAPGEIFYAPEKADLLAEVFRVAAEITE